MGDRFLPGFRPAGAGEDEEAIWLLYKGADLLVHLLQQDEPDGSSARFLRGKLSEIGVAPKRIEYIGSWDGLPCFAGSVAKEAPLPSGLDACGLRFLFPRLSGAMFEVAGTAFQIQYWDRKYLFCPGCAGALQKKPNERAKRCEPCDRDFFPPVVPAMIVRVTRGDEVLMTRQSRFPKGMYGLVAGFLEPGESLEACVAREVREETGIEIRNIRYFASQPWPFPHQIMIGFEADYASGEIQVDTKELEEARWFARDQMPMLPPPISIARRLVDAWLSG